jgi:arginine exporter protein ArgO
MDFWAEYGESLLRLGLYGGGIVAYTLLVTWLYVPMGQRLMFARRFGEERVATPGRRWTYVLLFPFVSFGFFLVVAGAMVFLSSFSSGTAPLGVVDVLTIAMATVLAIRVCSYFHERGAEELAKVMPLGLLGVVLVTNQIGTLGEALENMRLFLDHLPLVGIYFVVVVAVEFLLRAVYELLGRPGRRTPQAGRRTG